jgi:hypothetical protein
LFFLADIMKKKTEIECYKKASDSQKTLNARVLPVLCRQLYKKGLIPIEVKRLTRDILNITGHGGFYNADIMNQKLERLGWERNIVDNYIFDLILYYLECEGTYKVEVYTSSECKRNADKYKNN